MKLSDFTAKLTTFTRTTTARMLAAATLAGVALTAAPAAQAQQVFVGARFGAPVRVAPYRPVVEPRFRYFVDGRGFNDRFAYDEYLRHREWDRFHYDHFHRGWR